MFKFNFVDEACDEEFGAAVDDEESQKPKNQVNLLNHDLPGLLSKLPEAISYSWIDISSDLGTKATRETEHPDSRLTLPRRELFDMKLQVLSSGAEAEAEAEGPDAHSETAGDWQEATRYADTPSDLVRGVYEGGLKTWECSIDLARFLFDDRCKFHGLRRILELGCGSALPTLTLFHLHLSQPPEKTHSVEFHLQDYNLSVLELVTLPNLILTWYFSNAAQEFRAAESSSNLKPTASEEEEELELTLSPALLNAFQSSLQAYKISLRFTSGPWSLFPSANASDGAEEGGYDLLLTSETIYREESYDDLIAIFRLVTGSGPPQSGSSMESKLTQLSISSSQSNSESKAPPQILIASKVLYFGVGGGIDEFTRRVKEVESRNRNENKDGGSAVKVCTVWEQQKGVGRKILRVIW